MGTGPTTIISRLHGGAAGLLGGLALAATAAAPAVAKTPPAPKPAAFALSPAGGAGSMLMRGAPGRSLDGAVLVRNLSRRPVTVRLQAADIRTAANGNADYVTARPSQAGRWLRFAAPTVRLAPRSTRRAAFSVRIPTGTRGASRYAGIVGVDTADLASAASRTKAKGRSFSFKRISRQALPLTIRLPGPLKRDLDLRSAELDVQPAGTGLVLGLRPGGTELIQSARVQLRVSRGTRSVFTHQSTLGQLFPGSGLSYRIPWEGRPTEGDYHVVGTIRPERAAVVNIDETITFTPAKATELEDETSTPQTTPILPLWVWVVLGAAAALLIALLIAVVRLKRRTAALAVSAPRL